MELKTRVDAEFLPYINKPTRYLGNEYNVIIKNPQRVALRVALCYPDLYESGMRNPGFELLYYWLNAQSEIWAERLYAVWMDAETVLRDRHIPLFSLESKTALNAFPLIGVYFPGELFYTNLLNMLDLAGIPLRSTERTSRHPLIVGSGPAMNNPEPLADFLDIIIIGDSPESYLDVAKTLIAAQKDSQEKRGILQHLVQCSGLYIPSFYRPLYNDFEEFQGINKEEARAPDIIEKRNPIKGNEVRHPFKPLVPLTELETHLPFHEAVSEFQSNGKDIVNRFDRVHNSVFLESLAGELQKLFRRAGKAWIYSLRMMNEQYWEYCWEMLKETGLGKSEPLFFLGPSLQLNTDHISTAGFFSQLENLEFVLSPYAGSTRLRSVLNLNLRDQELLDAIKHLLQQKCRKLRLNFMIGLPTEKVEDILATADFLLKCAGWLENYPETELMVSIQIFSPKPHTPFQWEKQETLSDLEQKCSLLQEKLAGTSLKLNLPDFQSAWIQAVLLRGDRRMANVIESAWRLGARFDHLKDASKINCWKQAFAENDIVPEGILAPLSITVALPWDHLDGGSSKSDLKEEKLRAYQGKLHSPTKDIISLGKGIPREEFAAIIKTAAPKRAQDPDISGLRGDNSQARSIPQEAVRFGRRGRKRQTPVAVIKQKVRVRYSKTGMARFLSHLDIIRIVERSARMANIPLVYTQGLKQIPKISYGPPLPTGIASIAEYLDMELEIGRETHLQKQLNQYLPDGLQILQYKGIYTRTPALAAVVNRTAYEVFLTDVNLPQEWLRMWLEQSQVVVKRVVKDGTREVDIRSFVSKLECVQNKLLVTIDVVEGRTARITEVLKSLFLPHGIDYRHFLVQRAGQYIVKEDNIFTPLEILS